MVTHGVEEPTIFQTFSTRTVNEKIEFNTYRSEEEHNTYNLVLGGRPNDRVPSEENVNVLTSMGFSRERVVRALQTTGNNVEAATTLLLQE